jgi:small subunit ribosomal protein S16
VSVVIRLKRVGKKKKPSYRIVVAERKNPRDGKTIDSIGIYDPFLDNSEKVKLNKEKLDTWVKKGAQISEGTKSILKSVLKLL